MPPLDAEMACTRDENVRRMEHPIRNELAMQPLLLLLLLDSATAAQDAADVVVAPELTAAAPTRSAMAASTKLRRPQKLAWRWRRQQYFVSCVRIFGNAHRK